MGASFPIVPGSAFIEADGAGSSRCYRWSCSCTRILDRDNRKGRWLRNVWTALEAFRQHWENVHPDSDPVDWAVTHSKVPWLAGNIDSVSMITGANFSYTEAEEKKGMSRLSDIEARLRELEKEAAKYARFPKTDEWPVGTVIMYDWSPRVNDQAEVFTYAVLKATAEEWYWTGAWRQATKADRGNYDVLVERLADDNVSDIRVATPEDFDPLFPELEDLVGLEGTKTVEEVSAKLADKGIYVPVVKRADG